RDLLLEKPAEIVHDAPLPLVGKQPRERGGLPHTSRLVDLGDSQRWRWRRELKRTGTLRILGEDNAKRRSLSPNRGPMPCSLEGHEEPRPSRAARNLGRGVRPASRSGLAGEAKRRDT